MKRWLFENLGLKLAALLIAVILWAFVGTQQIMEQKVTVQSILTDMPPGAALGTDVKTSIPVVLTGRTDSFKDLDLSDLKAVVSLKGYQVDSKEVVVHPRIQSLPKGIMANLPDLTLRLVPVSEPNDTVKTKRRK